MSAPLTLERFLERAARDELQGITGPFEDLIGYRLRHDPALGLSVELEVAQRHLSHYGVAHGGVALVLLDTIGGVATFAAEPTLVRVATISLTANFVRAVEPGLVVATARIDQMGKSIAHLQMRLTAGNADGPPLATGIATYRLFRPLATSLAIS